VASDKRQSWPADKVERWSIDRLTPYARNSRTHSDAQVAQIAASIQEWGWTMPVLVSEDGTLIAGHGRVLAARKLGLTEVPVMIATGWSEAQRRAYVLADNQLAMNAGWDMDLLSIEMQDLNTEGFDLSLIGFDDKTLEDLLNPQKDESETGEGSPSEKLSDKFMVAPFSVLNAREGWWQDRKRAWIAMGIKSEEGRGSGEFNAAPGGQKMVAGYSDGKRLVGVENLKNSQKKQMDGVLMKSWTSHPVFYPQKASKEKELGRELTTAEFLSDYFIPPTDDAYSSGTSIFDPVLTELSYRWFSPSNGIIIDPFAGGSVRGIVASKLGRQYIGMDLRGEQVEANRAQAEAICSDPMPIWHEGDSRTIDRVCHDVNADMIFSCPPYADLEVYSDNPADLSTLPYDEFRSAYFEIIAKACSRLKNDSFAAFVVGEVRDKKGNYVDFVGDTIQAFRDAGLHYYNEAILVTAVGSLPIRAGKQFSSSRKLGKTHQNVLVFVKGDGKAAAKRCGVVDVDESMFDGIAGDES